MQMSVAASGSGGGNPNQRFKVGDTVVVVDHTCPMVASIGIVHHLWGTTGVDVKLHAGPIILFHESQLDRVHARKPLDTAMDVASQLPVGAARLGDSVPYIDGHLQMSWDLHDHSTTSSERQKRKDEGRCEECGVLLPISIHGLGECPDHPRKLPPDFKQ